MLETVYTLMLFLAFFSAGRTVRYVSLGKRHSLVELAIRLVTDATCVGTTCDVIWSIDRTVKLQPRITLGVFLLFMVLWCD